MEDIKANEAKSNKESTNEESDQKPDKEVNPEVKIILETEQQENQNDKSDIPPDANVTQSFDEEGNAGIQ